MPDFFLSIFSKLFAILPFVIAITILVFVHEWGHFWVARKNGVKVDVFSIGFGPELFGWTDTHGTRWRVSPYPFGGYVKFAGDADASSSTTDESAIAAMSDADRAATLAHKTPLQRIAVSFAGPLANYIFAFVMFAIVLLMQGMPDQTQLEIHEVMAKGNAEKAGLLAGDVLVRFNDQPIKNQHDAIDFLRDHGGQDVVVQVNRKGQDQAHHVVSLKAALYKEKDGKRENDRLGVKLKENILSYKAVGLLSALGQSLSYCWMLSCDMLKGIWAMIQGSGGQLGGVFTIGDMAKDAMDLGAIKFVMFLVVLSVNLGLINLFPIPVLDGGAIFLTTIEAIRKKPLSEKAQRIIFMVGLSIVGSLMAYTTLSDIVRKFFT